MKKQDDLENIDFVSPSELSTLRGDYVKVLPYPLHGKKCYKIRFGRLVILSACLKHGDYLWGPLFAGSVWQFSKQVTSNGPSKMMLRGYDKDERKIGEVEHYTINVEYQFGMPHFIETMTAKWPDDILVMPGIITVWLHGSGK
jgi:hypothetical protein